MLQSNRARMRTFGHRAGKNKTHMQTQKVYRETTTRHFQKEITKKFFDILNTIKLYHWNTFGYSTHKATDELYAKLSEHIDKFVEVMIGKTGIRINNIGNSIPVQILKEKKSAETAVEKFKSYLVRLSTNSVLMKMDGSSDLLNIRDEILADLNQFLYLLTLS